MCRLFLLALAVATATCVAGPEVRIEVARGTPAAELTIRLTPSGRATQPAPIEAVQIASADQRFFGSAPGQVYWAIARQPGAAALPVPTIIHYGDVPPGFGSSGAATRLPNGKYAASVQANGVWSRTHFRVTVSNTIE